MNSSKAYREKLQQLEEQSAAAEKMDSCSAGALLFPTQVMDSSDKARLPVTGVPRKVRGAQCARSQIVQLVGGRDHGPFRRETSQAAAISTCHTSANPLSAAESSVTPPSAEERVVDQDDDHDDDDDDDDGQRDAPLLLLSADTLRRRIADMPPQIDALIAEWREANAQAGIGGSSFQASTKFPEMPDEKEIQDFAASVRASIDPCGLASSDPRSLEVMQRACARNEKVASLATRNYHVRERAVLRWVLSSQQSTLRAIRADIGQLQSFIQWRGITMARVLSILGLINSAFARVVECAGIERSCKREAALLRSMGRAQIALRSTLVSQRERDDLDERLKALPFCQSAIELFMLVEEINDPLNAAFAVKDLAAAYNKIRRAEEQADKVLAQVRETEVQQEREWESFSRDYRARVDAMSSAEVDVEERRAVARFRPVE